MPSPKTCLIPALFSLALALSSARADTTAAVFSGNALLGPSSQSKGWRFRPTSDISITQLGVLDIDSNGLQGAHSVGLFDVATHSLIASATIPSGTAAALFDRSRFIDITSVTLTANTQYYLLADNLTLDVPIITGGITYAPAIHFLSQATGDGPTIFANPTFPTGTDGYLGPNFRYNVIPSPSSIALLALALPLASHRRRGRFRL